MRGTALKHKTIRSYEEFRQFFGEVDDETFLFRGQENYNWPLEHSLHRLKNLRAERQLTPPNEAARIQAFLASARGKQNNKKYKNVWDVMCLMQHHGIATRLLDFTFCPFVAAFFAATPASFDADNKRFISAIYAINQVLFRTNPDPISLELISKR